MSTIADMGFDSCNDPTQAASVCDRRLGNGQSVSLVFLPYLACDMSCDEWLTTANVLRAPAEVANS